VAPTMLIEQWSALEGRRAHAKKMYNR